MEIKIYTNQLGHMTNMAAISIYDTNLKKIFFSRANWPMTLNLICSIVYVSTNKVVQLMTLGWPWLILRQGQIWEKVKSIIFWKQLQP